MIVNLSRLQKQFNHLLKKSNQAPHRFIGSQNIHIKQLQHFERDYLKIILQQYQQNQFQFSPLQRICVKTDKERWVFQYPLPDLLMHYCLADELKSKIEPLLIENLYSYRPRKSSPQALKKVENYIRTYIRKYKGLLQLRGLYIVRKDISKYTDTIKTDQNSILWKKLQELKTSDQQLLFSALNPQLKDHTTYSFVPTGSPLANVLGNFYLNDLDQEMSRVANSFYIRFGDDILFITADFEIYQSSLAKIETHCAQLGLRFNPQKSYSVFLNAAGRPCSVSQLKGAAFFNYLGAKVCFREGVVLTSSKKKLFFQNLRLFLKNYQKNISLALDLNPTASSEQTKHALIQAINKKLSARSQDPLVYIDFILNSISNRDYLRSLDRDVAYELLKILHKSSSQKIFRHYKKLRQNNLLISLVKSKNARSA